MIYNLYEYLKTAFPALTFIVDGWIDNSPVDSMLLTATGGDPQHWFDRTDFTVQLISLYSNKVSTKQNIDLVYTELKNRFGLPLPEATVNSVVYPALIAAQISPIQSPGYIGTDQNKNHMYSVNFKITVGG